jgi:hypothetical protein
MDIESDSRKQEAARPRAEFGRIGAVLMREGMNLELRKAGKDRRSPGLRSRVPEFQIRSAL